MSYEWIKTRQVPTATPHHGAINVNHDNHRSILQTRALKTERSPSQAVILIVTLLLTFALVLNTKL
jgi:hypothetical protein